MAPQLIVLPSGIERVFPSVFPPEARSLNHWTDREVPHYAMFLIAEYILQFAIKEIISEMRTQH